MADEVLLPRTDLAASQMALLKDLAPTILPAAKAIDEASQQEEYPQIIIQLPQKIDMPELRNGQIGRYTTHVDFYVDLDKQGDLMDMLDKAEYRLQRLRLTKYPCRYVRGTLQSPQPIADNTTSRPLWHGVILINYELLERI